MGFEWTKENAEEVAKLWRDGKSAREIATILGGGLSRSGVIGKIRRLGLSNTRVMVKKKQVGAGNGVLAIPRKKSVPKRAKLPKPQLRVVVSNRPKTIDLDKAFVHRAAEGATPKSILLRKSCECAWPLPERDEKGLRMMCCAPVQEGRSFCATHGALGYTKRYKEDE